MRAELDKRNTIIDQLRSGVPVEWLGKETQSDSTLLIPPSQPYPSPNPHAASLESAIRRQNQVHPHDGATESFPQHKWVSLDSSVERSRTQQPDGMYTVSSLQHGMLGSPECMLNDSRTSSNSTNTLARQPISTQQHSDLTQYMIASTMGSPSRVSDAMNHDLFAGSYATMSTDARPDASRLTNFESVDHRDTIGHIPASYDNGIMREPHMSMPLNVSHSLDTNTVTMPVATMKAQLAETKEQNAILQKELELRENVHLPSLTLGQHLDEIRVLRLRLEESIRNNDLLREQLQTQLTYMNTASQRKSDICALFAVGD